MRSEQPAPPIGGTCEAGPTQDATRLQRNAEAVIAQYIQDLTRAA
jgi:hypothetical protein